MGSVNLFHFLVHPIGNMEQSILVVQDMSVKHKTNGMRIKANKLGVLEKKV